MQAIIGSKHINAALNFTESRVMSGIEKLVTEDEYREVLKRFLEIAGWEHDTDYAEELEQLITLMEIYEEENCSDAMCS